MASWVVLGYVGVAMCWWVAWWLFFFLSFVVVGAKGRGRKRGKGKESEIVKYIYIFK